MMENLTTPWMLYILMGINAVYSLLALQDNRLMERGYFRVGDILGRKESWRLLSSAFLHVDYVHLGVNMYTLYIFGEILNPILGHEQFLMVYLGALLGGNLLSLWVNHKNYSYTAVGASGAVSGIVFATVILFPDMNLGIMFIPIGIPGWIFALLYTAYSIYGVRSQLGNVGHDAHLGGGIAGAVVLIALYPNLLVYSWKPILAILIPAVIFFLVLWKQPDWFKR